MKKYLSILLVTSLILCGCTSSGKSGKRRSERDDDDTVWSLQTTSAETETSPSATVTEPRETEPSDSEVYSFSLEPIMWDSAVLGQVAVPEGYTHQTVINYCDDTTCLGYPIRVSEVLTRADDNSLLMFKCGEEYIERVSSSFFSQVEGELDSQLYIFMKTYRNASAICDEIAQTIASDAAYVTDEDMSLYDNALSARNEEYRQMLVEGQVPGMTLDWEELTASQRVYSCNINGIDCAICVACEVRGYQITSSGYGFTDTFILWDIPGYYIMVCPMSEYQENHDSIFQMFLDNTQVNDQFVDANIAIADSIASDVIANWNMQCAASAAYAQAMTAMTFASVESAMAADNYSSDRFSDYIFDQNNYTLSDGSSVQISTSYDYVYEGDNGVVYYSNSAFDQPGGTTQLYPD